MSIQPDELRAAFADSGYDVGDIATNRKQVRVTLHEERAESDALRDIVYELLGEEGVLGLDVTTETVEGQDTVQTVISFRLRT